MATVPVTAALILAGLLYARGWLHFRSVIPLWRAASFMGGLVLLWVAAASPLAMLDEELLTAHMAQHLLLMTAGPAFLLLGFPGLLLGAGVRTPVRSWFRIFANPLFCWCAAAAVLVGWHIPAVFALGFPSMMGHHAEQATFFNSALPRCQPLVPQPPAEHQPQRGN